MDNLIISHIDADGILSARIIYLFLGKNADVYFPEWDDFGVPKPAIEYIRQARPRNLYVLDLGTDRESLGAVSSLVDEGAVENVVWIDHHPPDCDPSEFDNIMVVHTDKTCAAGMAYEYVKVYAEPSEWMRIWAVIGIYGDVAVSGELSARILEEVRSQHPWLFGRRVFSSTRYEVPQVYTTYFNTPRRMAFHYGAYTAFRACGEIEAHGSLDLLLSDDPVLLARYPNVLAVKYLVSRYREVRRQVLDSAEVYEYDNIVVAFIDSRYDVGGYVASVLAKRYAKAVFCVNLGLPGWVKVTGRAPEGFQVDVGAVLRAFGGGGHKCAASAKLNKCVSKNDLIDQILMVVGGRASQE